MQQLRFELELELDASREPEVRAWVDMDPDATLDSEIELSLRKSARGTWVATVPAPVRPIESFLYRVALAAGAGTIWSLCIRDGHGREVLSDSDVMPLAKSWVIGSCPLTRRRRPSAEAGRGNATRLRPGLIALAGGSANDDSTTRGPRPRPKLTLIHGLREPPRKQGAGGS